MTEPNHTAEFSKGTSSQLGKTAGVAIVAIIGLLLGYMVFKDEIAAISTFTQTVKRLDERVSVTEATLRKHEGRLDDKQIRMLNIEDFQGDTTERLDRNDKTIGANSSWRVAQEKRATQRIKDHEFRDYRLEKMESQIARNHKLLVEYIHNENQRRVRQLERRVKND